MKDDYNIQGAEDNNDANDEKDNRIMMMKKMKE